MTDRRGPDDEPELEAIGHGSVTVDGPTLTLTGEIDTVLVRAWARRHPAPPAGVQTIDVADVTFFGSAAIAYLIRVARAAAPTRLQLLSPGRPVRRPLEVTGVLGMFDVLDRPGPTARGHLGP